MLSSFGAVLLELLDERAMSVPELADELAELDLSYTFLDLASAVSDPRAPCYVMMVAAIVEVLDLDREEHARLDAAVWQDASWQLICNIYERE